MVAVPISAVLEEEEEGGEGEGEGKTGGGHGDASVHEEKNNSAKRRGMLGRLGDGAGGTAIRATPPRQSLGGGAGGAGGAVTGSPPGGRGFRRRMSLAPSPTAQPAAQVDSTLQKLHVAFDVLANEVPMASRGVQGLALGQSVITPRCVKAAVRRLEKRILNEKQAQFMIRLHDHHGGGSSDHEGRYLTWGMFQVMVKTLNKIYHTSNQQDGNEGQAEGGGKKSGSGGGDGQAKSGGSSTNGDDGGDEGMVEIGITDADTIMRLWLEQFSTTAAGKHQAREAASRAAEEARIAAEAKWRHPRNDVLKCFNEIDLGRDHKIGAKDLRAFGNLRRSGFERKLELSEAGHMLEAVGFDAEDSITPGQFRQMLQDFDTVDSGAVFDEWQRRVWLLE